MTDSRHQSYEKHKQELEDTYPVGTLVVLEADEINSVHEDTYITVVTGHSVMTLSDDLSQHLSHEEVADVEGPRIHCSTNHPEHQSTVDLNDSDHVIGEAAPPNKIIGMYE